MSISTPFSPEDVLFGLVFGLAIVFIFALRAHRLPEAKTILAALLLKLVSTLAYNAIVVYYYAGVADTMGYHREGIEYADIIRVNGWLDYLSTEPFFGPGGYSTSRFVSLSGFVHFWLFDSFTASSFVFALIGFAGQILLYRVFVARYPDPRLRAWWKVGILFFPTLTFWSAGMLKDPMGLWGLGCAVWGVHRLLERFSLKNVGLVILGLYTLFLFRPQLLPVMLIALVPWFLMAPRAGRALIIRVAEHVAFRSDLRLVLVLVSGAGLLIVWNIQPTYSLAALPKTLVDLGTVYENFDTSTPVTYDASWPGLIKAAPAAVVLTLYRPFIWEGSGLLVRLAAIENLVLLILSMRALFHVCAYFGIFRRALRSPLFLTCLVFVLVYALAVGISTPNLGTISRYRMPLIPFFVGALIILEYHMLELRTAMKSRMLGLYVESRSLPSS